MRRAVLIGAGHAHLETIRHADEFTRRGFELVLIAPDQFWYSGLATGMLGGRYSGEMDRVDVESLLARKGAEFIRARATHVDPTARTITLDRGDTLGYDVLSLDVGSEVPVGAVPGLAENGIPVKPIRFLWALRNYLTTRYLSSTKHPTLRIVVIGGGYTGCEVAANLMRLTRINRGDAEITLLASGDRVLEGHPRRAGAIVARVLEEAGVRIEFGARVTQVESGRVMLADGRPVPFDLLVSAIGLIPSPLIQTLGLPTDASGGLVVDPFLRSVGDPRVFGGGDCVAFQTRDLAKVGVYAVRQAPILRHNLLATLTGTRLREFHPQRHVLLIMNLGDGTGLATWRTLAWRGRSMFWLKDRIDQAFLRRYRV